MNEEKLSLMIADAELFIYFQQRKINKIIEGKGSISVEETAEILKYFSDTLFRISDLLSSVIQINNSQILNEVFDISINTLGWIVYTFPSLEIYTNLFPENFRIKDKDLLDFLAYNMVELENVMSNYKDLKSLSIDIADSLREASSMFGYLSETSKKGLLFS